MRTRLRGKFSLLFLAFAVLLAVPAIALADLVGNNLDTDTLDNQRETVNLDSHGKSATVEMYILPSTGSGDSDADCNFDANTEKLKLRVFEQSDPNNAVSSEVWDEPGATTTTTTNDTIEFTGCEDPNTAGIQNGQTVKMTSANVSPATGTTFDANIDFQEVSNTTGGTFDTQTGRFVVKVAKDVTAPAPPVITNPANTTTTNSSTMTLSGTAEAGSTVELFDGPPPVNSKGTTQADASGNWSKTLTGVADGPHPYMATATDAAGNTSPPSVPVTVIVQTQQATNLSVDPASGTYDGTTTLKATLTKTSDGTFVGDKTIVFSLRGSAVCDNDTADATKPDCPKTNTSGVATLNNVSLSGINAGGPSGTGYAGAVSASFVGDSGFSASNGSNNLTVNKAVLDVNADNNSKTYGAANPTNLTYTFSGFVNGDNASNVTINGSANCSIAASAGPNAGTYTDAITCAPGTLSSTNYNFVTGSKGTLTIEQATPVVNITWSNSTYNGSPNAASASVTGVGDANIGSADSFTYYSGNTDSGTPLPGAPTNAGTYTVKAVYNATTNYKSAFATATITIAKATPTFEWNNPAPVDAGTVLGSTQLNAVVKGVDNNVLAGTSVYTPAAGTVLNAGTQTLKVDFTPSAANAGNYNGASMEVQITVSPFNFGNGFYQPVDNRMANGVKGGSTVPMKFEVFQSLSGNELKSTSAIKTWTTSKVNCTTMASLGEDAIEQYVTGGTSLRWDTTGDFFILNWQAPKAPVGTCYTVNVVANDGSANPATTLTAFFRIR